MPLEGPFDYLVPEHLIPTMSVGMRVKAFLGYKARIGFVTGLLEQSPIAKLKSIQSLCDAFPVFNSIDLGFAREFSAYYGCSLGESLTTILRNRQGLKISITRPGYQPLLSLYKCLPEEYSVKIKEIIDGYMNSAALQGKEGFKFLILVPDSFRVEMISHSLPFALLSEGAVKIGTRSSVFESDGHYDCVMMVDEEDDSFKQEQSPMYETRQVLLSRSRIYGFDVAFVGISPSVELMEMVREGKVKNFQSIPGKMPSFRAVDLSNYKFVPGLISPPVRDGLDAALKSGKKSILVLNRRGSYRLTRCVDCSEILKCANCDSPLIYSKAEGKFLCRHCAYTAPGDSVCPKCHKPSWRSQGIGVEQVQVELRKIFPQAKVAAFEKKNTVAKEEKKSFADFDILVATNVVLRFEGELKAELAAFIDFDAELNRLDIRSAFNAFSLALHVGSMAAQSVFIQTRNSHHYVIENLCKNKIEGFYEEELKLRRELGFSPFKHWVKISWRGKIEKTTQEMAQQAYNILSKSVSDEDFIITPPLVDTVGRKRNQFRLNVMVQAQDVPKAVAFIKSTLAKIRRRGKVIVTINVDP